MPLTFDTSGGVIIPGKGLDTLIRWPNLDAFTQGYVEAAFASFRAGDIGHWDDASARKIGFRHLAPATLAAMMADCEADKAMGERIGSGEDRSSKRAGQKFWKERQTGNLFDCPPLTLFLGDDGLIYQRVAS